MDKGGRPPIQIDKDQFEKLCQLHCTQEEIADFFDASPDTIARFCEDTYGKGFAEVYRIKRGRGKVSLRRKQMEVAQSGNVAMLIFLGKNYLNQKDKHDVEQTTREIKIEIDESDKDL